MWLPLILVLVCGAAYGLFFVVPYYVNDLDQFPLQEVAGGAHDPSALWPYRDGGVESAIWGYGGALHVRVRADRVRGTIVGGVRHGA